MGEGSVRNGKDFNGCISGFFHIFDFGQNMNRKYLLHSSGSGKGRVEKSTEIPAEGMTSDIINKGKKRAPNLVARLMGLDPLPEESKSSAKEPATKEQIKYPVRLSKSRSINVLWEDSNENNGSQKSQLRSRSFREHPQEEQLEQFKKDFAANQALHSRYGSHGGKSNNNNMGEDAISKRMSTDRQRQNQSKEFLEALDYLKKHKDVIFKAHRDLNPVSPTRSSHASGSKHCERWLLSEPDPLTSFNLTNKNHSSSKSGFINKKTHPAHVRSISASKNPPKIPSPAVPEKIVILKSNASAKSQTIENTKGYSGQIHFRNKGDSELLSVRDMRQPMRERRGLSQERCECKREFRQYNLGDPASFCPERNMTAKPSRSNTRGPLPDLSKLSNNSGHSSGFDQCSQGRGKGLTKGRKEEKRLFIAEEADYQRGCAQRKIWSGSQIVPEPRKSLDDKTITTSFSSGSQTLSQPFKKQFNPQKERVPRSRSNMAVPQSRRNRSSTNDIRRSRPPTSLAIVSNDESGQGRNTPDGDAKVCIDEENEFPSPNCVLDGLPQDSPSPISTKDIKTDLQELSMRLGSLKLDDEDGKDSDEDLRVDEKEDGRDSDEDPKFHEKESVQKPVPETEFLSVQNHGYGDIPLSEAQSLQYQCSEAMFWVDEKEANFAYVKNVLCTAGFNDESIPPFTRWYSTSKPISPQVFSNLENLFYSPLENNSGATEGRPASHSVMQRQLLFDMVNEILSNKFHQFREPQAWASHSRMHLRYMPTGRQLIQEVWDEICSLPRADCNVFGDLEALIKRDISGEAPWRGSHQDVEKVGVSIENLLFETLLEEFLLDMLSAETC